MIRLLDYFYIKYLHKPFHKCEWDFDNPWIGKMIKGEDLTYYNCKRKGCPFICNHKRATLQMLSLSLYDYLVRRTSERNNPFLKHKGSES